MLLLVSLIASTLIAQDAQITSLIHRHNAHAFVYVLGGSVVMQVKGWKEVRCRPPSQALYARGVDILACDIWRPSCCTQTSSLL